MIALLFVAACTTLPVTTLTVGGQSVRAEIAATAAHRERGLMERKEMGANEGMLFVYRDARERSFWMKNTPLPLTIAFADSSGTIVRLVDMRPFDTKHYQSLAPARYALEMNQGWFEQHGIGKGTVIEGIPRDLEVE